MKIRSLIVITLALSGVEVLHAQPQRGVSCGKILHGKSVESFVQRVSCARNAVVAGDTEQAFELMAPIYNDAIRSKSNTHVDSKAKLGDIVRLRISRDAADRLIGTYGADSVYAALTDSLGINPSTGRATRGKSRLMLPDELVRAVNAELEKEVPEAPAIPTPEEVSIPEGEMPEGEIPGTVMPSAPPAPVTKADREKAAVAFTQANIQLFAVNLVLDQMFIEALKKDDQEVCQNLIKAVSTGESLKVVQAAAQGKTSEAMYTSLKKGMSSWFSLSWFKSKPAKKSAEDLFGEWIDVIPVAGLVEKLLKAGIPDANARAVAEKYLRGDLSVETPQLALSKAIMLMRNAYRVIYDPVRGVPFMLEDERFGQIADVYLALNKGLLDSNFSINNSTKFTVKVPVFTFGKGVAEEITKFTGKSPLSSPEEVATYDLQELNVRLGEIVGTLTAEVLAGKKASAKQVSKLRAGLVKAAKIGGMLAIGAAVVYGGYVGLNTVVGQAAVVAAKTGGTKLLEYMSPSGTQISGGYGYAGAALSTAASGGEAVSTGAGMVANASSELASAVHSLAGGAAAAPALTEAVAAVAPAVVQAAAEVEVATSTTGWLSYFWGK